MSLAFKIKSKIRNKLKKVEHFIMFKKNRPDQMHKNLIKGRSI